MIVTPFVGQQGGKYNEFKRKIWIGRNVAIVNIGKIAKGFK